MRELAGLQQLLCKHQTTPHVPQTEDLQPSCPSLDQALEVTSKISTLLKPHFTSGTAPGSSQYHSTECPDVATMLFFVGVLMRAVETYEIVVLPSVVVNNTRSRGSCRVRLGDFAPSESLERWLLAHTMLYQISQLETVQGLMWTYATAYGFTSVTQLLDGLCSKTQGISQQVQFGVDHFQNPEF